MIGRPRTHRRGHGRAAARAELVGVDAQLHARLPRCGEDRGRIGRCEDTVFAENVAPLGQTGARNCGNHLVADERDVALAPCAIFGRDLVGAHEGRRDLDGMLFLQPGDDAKLLQLRRGRQPVA
jgi:hypothetical protein